MDRRDLATLSHSELNYYLMKNKLALSDSEDDIIEAILTHQAQVLSERALEAQRLLRDPSCLRHLNLVTPTTSTAEARAGTGTGPSFMESEMITKVTEKGNRAVGRGLCLSCNYQTANYIIVTFL